MHNAYNHGVETHETVKAKVIANDNTSGVWCYLGARWANFRMVRQAMAPGDNAVDKAVCSGRII